MGPNTRLAQPERGFFSALDRVVYGNPFSDDRAREIRQLLPGLTPEQLARDREALARAVAQRLAAFAGAAAVQRLDEEDRRLVQGAHLYVCYHRQVVPLDDLIARELQHHAPQAADHIARSVVADLAGCGIDEAAALRCLGFFYQLRRAFHFIVRSLPGESVPMRRLRRALWDNVFTHDMRAYRDGLWHRMEDFSTLLLGETGTGKGEAAAAIGRSGFIPYLPGQRRFAAGFMTGFLATNLSQFPETLIESELFGHRKGAFTGAVEHHAGVLERCSPHGALFLDEIGEVPVAVQIKLLRVLQDRGFTPLGSREVRHFAGRVIAATNQPLAQLRAQGRFRDDFYYRLCSDVIELPTLRQRLAESPGELEELVRVLVERIAGEPRPVLVGQVLQAIAHDLPRGYAWPGNVRELEQAVRRILLTGRYAGAPVTGATADEPLARLADAGALNARDLLGRYCALLYTQLGTYAQVAARTGLDRRTARKYVEEYGPPRSACGASPRGGDTSGPAEPDPRCPLGLAT